MLCVIINNRCLISPDCDINELKLKDPSTYINPELQTNPIWIEIILII